MSALELQNFQNQIALLSYAEQLSIVEFIIKSMQKRENDNQLEEKNALDVAIEEEKNGEFEYFDNFADLMSSVGNDA